MHHNVLAFASVKIDSVFRPSSVMSSVRGRHLKFAFRRIGSQAVAICAAYDISALLHWKICLHWRMFRLNALTFTHPTEDIVEVLSSP